MYLAMNQSSYHLQLAQKLALFSARLDELIDEVACHESQSLPPELVDELAITTGEIALVLMEHLCTHQTNHLIRQALSDATRLKEGARSPSPQREQLKAAITVLTREVEEIIREDKRAA
jgi:hypothetical protein